MAKGYNPTEYMYSSARIRALENKIASKERLRHLSDAESADAILSGLSEYGFEIIRQDGAIDREATLESLLVTSYGELASMETGDAVDFLRYQYDANNIKSVIKCASRNISPDQMLSPLGTVGIDALKQAFIDKDYSAFPENMKIAIADAEEAFAETSNPQKVDFIIDKACFADMLASAERSGIELAKKLVRAKIDLCNIMMTLRVMRMKLGKTAAGVLSEVFIGGGGFERGGLDTRAYLFIEEIQPAFDENRRAEQNKRDGFHVGHRRGENFLERGFKEFESHENDEHIHNKARNVFQPAVA